MAFQPNIGPGQRVAYVVIGLAVTGAAAFGPWFHKTDAVVFGALGVLTIASGGVGF